jgi:Sugar-binding cellulase-like
MTTPDSPELGKCAHAITMWDFSWLERRWPGAGYENWDRSLDELTERGYDAIRIDAYPHFHAVDPRRQWEIAPCWNQHTWGSPARNHVCLQPSLLNFLEKCAARRIRVALSSWYQDDTTHARNRVQTPEVHAMQWAGVLKEIDSAGLTPTLLFVDLCNEWPFSVWAPFFNVPGTGEDLYVSPRSLQWMERAISTLRDHTELPLTFSLVGLPRDNEGHVVTDGFGFLDLWEPHLWMVHGNKDEFYKKVGYDYPRWDSGGYEKVVLHAEKLYRSARDYWLGLLEAMIQDAVRFSETVDRPLVTTECWGIVDYKDWPLLDWGWVKECCAAGTVAAAKSGRWSAIATSNFCGPQFVGMWSDIEWHQRLTNLIKTSHFKAMSSDRTGFVYE